MKSFNLKKFTAVSALSLVALLGTSEIASAQGNWRNDQNQDRRAIQQREKMEKERAKAEQKRIQEEQKRQAELNRQNTWNSRHSGNDRSNGNGYYNGNANGNSNRYRVNRNGRYYNTDQRGAEMLRQAVNAGYRQGFEAGRNDRNSRRRSSWSNSSVYRSGTYGYQSYVDRSQYQYYFQQGFQKGYQDGYNSRNQYGSGNGGGILAAILGQILNIQSY